MTLFSLVLVCSSKKKFGNHVVRHEMSCDTAQKVGSILFLCHVVRHVFWHVRLCKQTIM
jgi:hypothetical protein